jgi:cytochrome P450
MSGTAAVGASIAVEDLERDPYPVYERLREEEPVSWVESVGLWLVTRWDDVNTVDKSPATFTAETEPSTLKRTFGANLLASEGAYHDRIRSIIQPWFRRGAIGHFPDEVITPIATELIDAFAGRGEVDLVSEFAEPLAVRVLRRATGLEGVDDDTLRRWFQELAQGASNFEGDPAKQAVADAASEDVNRTVAALAERLRDAPDAFDIHAHRRPHLAFAAGAHVCVGALLARMETRRAMRLLLGRLPGLRLDPDRPTEMSGWEFRSPAHLHLLFDPA